MQELNKLLYKGRRVAKTFKGYAQKFLGTVIAVDLSVRWGISIAYDDGDKETMDEEELLNWLLPKDADQGAVAPLTSAAPAQQPPHEEMQQTQTATNAPPAQLPAPEEPSPPPPPPPEQQHQQPELQLQQQVAQQSQQALQQPPSQKSPKPQASPAPPTLSPHSPEAGDNVSAAALACVPTQPRAPSAAPAVAHSTQHEAGDAGAGEQEQLGLGAGQAQALDQAQPQLAAGVPDAPAAVVSASGRRAAGAGTGAGPSEPGAARPAHRKRAAADAVVSDPGSQPTNKRGKSCGAAGAAPAPQALLGPQAAPPPPQHQLHSTSDAVLQAPQLALPAATLPPVPSLLPSQQQQLGQQAHTASTGVTASDGEQQGAPAAPTGVIPPAAPGIQSVDIPGRFVQLGSYIGTCAANVVNGVLRTGMIIPEADDGKGDVCDQMAQCLGRLDDILAAAGSQKERLLSVNVYISGLEGQASPAQAGIRVAWDEWAVPGMHTNFVLALGLPTSEPQVALMAEAHVG